MNRELKTFLSVARLGTFAAAGQQVGLTQSAVSAQIKNLEQALGVRLFDRTGRAATLNAAGLRAIPLAEEMLATFARMGDPQSSLQGLLRIGAVNTVQTGLLPKALLQLNREAPQISVKLTPGVSLNLLSQVDAGEIDLALMIRPPFALPKELHLEVLATEPFVLITALGVPGDDPLLVLREQPLIRYDRNSFGGRRVSQFLREHKLQVRQVLELDELDAIARMVRMGLGVALIPLAGLWLEQPEGLRILPLGDLSFDRELVLVGRYGQRQSALQQAFRRCLQPL
ncbi:MAG: LysR family transcriptional regulator [Pseudomonas sp.]|nr:LysR family transcriptional regulator [Pseudomonas sp.]